jgi:SAM-dependent methyltransferase
MNSYMATPPFVKTVPGLEVPGQSQRFHGIGRTTTRIDGRLVPIRAQVGHQVRTVRSVCWPVDQAADGMLRTGRAMTGSQQRALGRVFNEVPELYDRVRPGYPDELIADLAAIAGLDGRSAVLEVGCGTGQATRSLAALGCSVTAVEPGLAMAALARERLAGVDNVDIETATFEEWDDRGRRFDLLVAASSWHWVDPAIGWPRAREVLRPGGWMALIGHVVVRRPGEPEVYAETADLHERFSPGNPGWGHPPLEDGVRTSTEGWGLVEDPGPLFGPTIVRWYPTVQWFDGPGFADLLRSTSLYRALDPDVREPLLGAIAERIRTRMGDRAPRRYLGVLRAGQRAD